MKYLVFIVAARRMTKLTVVPQNLLNVEVKPIYDSSSQLREVRVHWRNQVCIIVIVKWSLKVY